jgi:phytoene/squalene synthetase
MKKAVKWGSYFYNFVRIHDDHELQKNGAYYPMDPVSHRGLSMRELRKRVDVPATAAAGNAQGGGEENHVKAASRDIATLPSDILIDSILISSITDTRKMAAKQMTGH